MRDVASLLRDEDLVFLLNLLAPGTPEKERRIKALRDDEDILEGMLANERLFRRITGEPDSILRVSPFLFFAVLLSRARRDMSAHPYTVEGGQSGHAIVFDGQDVTHILSRPEVRAYLVDMLASFTRINSYAFRVRVRQGVWRSIRVSDFDVASLLRFSELIEEQHRFQTYKRIADICLFTLGIFSRFADALQRFSPAGRIPLDSAGTVDRGALARLGREYFLAASRHEAAHAVELDGVLLAVAEHFGLLVKPLSYISDNYLAGRAGRLFLK